MTFTKTTPTKPGAYWWRYEFWRKEVPSRLFQVWANGQVFGDLSYVFTSTELEPFCYAKTIGGEWCGPLVPVEEVEKAYMEAIQHCRDNTGGCGADFWRKQHWIDSRARRVVEGETA